jgi:ABC-type branched-subunit amino acid transport system ATPase component
MQNDQPDDVTAEMLMQQVEELLLMDELSEGEKSEILKNVLSILKQE